MINTINNKTYQVQDVTTLHKRFRSDRVQLDSDSLLQDLTLLNQLKSFRFSQESRYQMLQPFHFSEKMTPEDIVTLKTQDSIAPEVNNISTTINAESNKNIHSSGNLRFPKTASSEVLNFDFSPESLISKLDSTLTETSSTNHDTNDHIRNTIMTSKSYYQSTSTPSQSIPLDVKSLSCESSDISQSLDLSNLPPIKDLLINAEGLLFRLQNAYIQRTSALNDMIISRDSIAEELEQANTRTESLRSQLAVLANTVNTKDLRIYELERELQRAKLEISVEPSLTPQYQSPDTSCHENHQFSTSQFSSCKRYKNWTFNYEKHSECPSVDLDTTVDSDCESGTSDSIFTRPQSPALTSSSSVMIRSPQLEPSTNSEFPSLSSSHGTDKNSSTQFERSTPQPQRTLLGFLTGRTNGKEVCSPNPMRCKNCLGRDSKAAWDIVGLLRAENQGLKGRIVELENAVDGALDAMQIYF